MAAAYLVMLLLVTLGVASASWEILPGYDTDPGNIYMAAELREHGWNHVHSCKDACAYNAGCQGFVYKDDGHCVFKAGSAGHLRASRTRDPRSTLYIIWGAHHGPPPPPAYVEGEHSKPFVIIALLVLVVITIGCIGGICYMCCDGGAQGQGERRRSSAKPAALPSQKSARQIMRESREGRGAQVYGKLGNLAVQQTTPAKPALTMKSPMKLKDYKASLQGGGAAQAATMH